MLHGSHGFFGDWSAWGGSHHHDQEEEPKQQYQRNIRRASRAVTGGITSAILAEKALESPLVKHKRNVKLSMSASLSSLSATLESNKGISDLDSASFHVRDDDNAHGSDDFSLPALGPMSDKSVMSFNTAATSSTKAAGLPSIQEGARARMLRRSSSDPIHLMKLAAMIPGNSTTRGRSSGKEKEGKKQQSLRNLSSGDPDDTIIKDDDSFTTLASASSKRMDSSWATAPTAAAPAATAKKSPVRGRMGAHSRTPIRRCLSSDLAHMRQFATARSREANNNNNSQPAQTTEARKGRFLARGGSCKRGMAGAGRGGGGRFGGGSKSPIRRTLSSPLQARNLPNNSSSKAPEAVHKHSYNNAKSRGLSPKRNKAKLARANSANDLGGGAAPDFSFEASFQASASEPAGRRVNKARFARANSAGDLDDMTPDFRFEANFVAAPDNDKQKSRAPKDANFVAAPDNNNQKSRAPKDMPPTLKRAKSKDDVCWSRSSHEASVVPMAPTLRRAKSAGASAVDNDQNDKPQRLSFNPLVSPIHENPGDDENDKNGHVIDVNNQKGKRMSFSWHATFSEDNWGENAGMSKSLQESNHLDERAGLRRTGTGDVGMSKSLQESNHKEERQRLRRTNTDTGISNEERRRLRRKGSHSKSPPPPSFRSKQQRSSSEPVLAELDEDKANPSLDQLRKDHRKMLQRNEALNASSEEFTEPDAATLGDFGESSEPRDEKKEGDNDKRCFMEPIKGRRSASASLDGASTTMDDSALSQNLKKKSAHESVDGTSATSVGSLASEEESAANNSNEGSKQIPKKDAADESEAMVNRAARRARKDKEKEGERERRREKEKKREKTRESVKAEDAKEKGKERHRKSSRTESTSSTKDAKSRRRSDGKSESRRSRKKSTPDQRVSLTLDDLAMSQHDMSASEKSQDMSSSEKSQKRSSSSSQNSSKSSNNRRSSRGSNSSNPHASASRTSRGPRDSDATKFLESLQLDTVVETHNEDASVATAPKRSKSKGHKSRGGEQKRSSKSSKHEAKKSDAIPSESKNRDATSGKRRSRPSNHEPVDSEPELKFSKAKSGHKERKGRSTSHTRKGDSSKTELERHSQSSLDVSEERSFASESEPGSRNSDPARQSRSRQERRGKEKKDGGIGATVHDVEQVTFRSPRADRGFPHPQDPFPYGDPYNRGGPYYPPHRHSDVHAMPFSHHNFRGGHRGSAYQDYPYPPYPGTSHPYDPMWVAFWSQQMGYHPEMDPRLLGNGFGRGAHDRLPPMHPIGEAGNDGTRLGGRRGEGSESSPGAMHHRRRHSIGSTHSRDAILQEVTVAMHQDYRLTSAGCKCCGQGIMDCLCNGFHEAAPAAVPSAAPTNLDTTRHTQAEKQQTKPRDVETRLASSNHGGVSLFDTFGIRKPTGAAARRGMAGSSTSNRIDESVHTSSHRNDSGAPPAPFQPLYHRPAGFEVNDYVHMSSTQRLMGPPTKSATSQNHRGRTLQRFQDEAKEEYDDGLPSSWWKGGSVMSSAEKRRSAVEARRLVNDDGSLRYPPMRSYSAGSKSGRRSISGRFSVMSESSFASFAI